MNRTSLAAAKGDSDYSDQELDTHLFALPRMSNSARSGASVRSYLNINLLPALAKHIISRLTREEVSSLCDYELQKLLLEKAFERDVVGPKKDFETFVDSLLEEIRSGNSFWLIDDRRPAPQEEMRQQQEQNKQTEFDGYPNNLRQAAEAISEFQRYHSDLSSVLHTEPPQFPKRPDVLPQSSCIIVPDSDQEVPSEVLLPQHDPRLNSKYNLRRRLRNHSGDLERGPVYPSTLPKVPKGGLAAPPTPPPQLPSFDQYFKHLKKRKHNDLRRRQDMFVQNPSKSIAKFDLTILHYILAFLFDRPTDVPVVPASPEIRFRMQNFLLYFFLTDDPDKSHVDSTRRNLLAYVTNPTPKEDRKPGSMQEETPDIIEEGVAESKGEEMMKPENPLEGIDLSEINGKMTTFQQFLTFCALQGFPLATLTVKHNETLVEKYFNFIRNILDLCMEYLSQIKDVSLLQGGGFKIRRDPCIRRLGTRQNRRRRVKAPHVVGCLENLKQISQQTVKRIVAFYISQVDRERFSKHLGCLSEYLAFSKHISNNVDAESQVNYGNMTTISEAKPRISNTINEVRRSFGMDLEDDSQGSNDLISRTEFLTRRPGAFKTFLEGLRKHFDNPINNRLIANHLGHNTKASEVKSIKRHYLSFLRRRAKEGNTPVRDELDAEISRADPTDFFRHLVSKRG